jgi:hypothetical protein
MTTLSELVALYTSMVEDGEGEMLSAEISECQRLQELYEERLQCLMDRNPRLPLVALERTDLFEHYTDHFCEKIRVNSLAVEAAREVLQTYPPKRPHSGERSPPDAFMMDLENGILEEFAGEPLFMAAEHAPRGTRRWKIPEWAALVKKSMYPFHSDVDWHEYVEWVKGGGGDEWFQPKNKVKTLFCTKHDCGPLDVWYDCDTCFQEEEGKKPTDNRYIRAPLRSINGRRTKATTPGDL